MNLEKLKQLHPYIETSYFINTEFINYLGFDYQRKPEQTIESLLKSISEVSRVLPLKSTRDRVYLLEDEGILYFSDEFSELFVKLKQLVVRHESTLFKIKQIRNRYEHQMHDIFDTESLAHSITFNVEDDNSVKQITLSSTEIIQFLIDFNKVISYIQESLKFDDFPNNREFVLKFKKFNFLDFNKIYTDNNLLIIAKLMHTFD